jgi:hypothetical protein
MIFEESEHRQTLLIKGRNSTLILHLVVILVRLAPVLIKKSNTTRIEKWHPRMEKHSRGNNILES